MEEDWDGFEEYPMLVHFGNDGDVETFMTVRCDRFYLDQKTGTVTLWKLRNGQYNHLFELDEYDSYSIDMLYEESNAVN
jgi:hypothetical protein